MSGQVVYLSAVPQSGDIELFNDQPDVLDVPQVAALLGVVPATVRREIARNKLQHFHVGKRVRITKRQLIAYVEEQGASA